MTESSPDSRRGLNPVGRSAGSSQPPELLNNSLLNILLVVDSQNGLEGHQLNPRTVSDTGNVVSALKADCLKPVPAWL